MRLAEALALTTLGLASNNAAHGRTVEEDLASAPGVVDASSLVPELLVDLKYATEDNFLKRNVYGELRRCYLQKDAAKMLAAASKLLRQRDAKLRLLAYDCLRPRRVQLQMWEVVKGTPEQSYVANPHSKTGSIHNYGCAIDLTVASDDGKPLEMGTPFDHFGVEAQPRKETTLVVKGAITFEALANRLLLREVMVRAGFLPIGNEWWHFNCATHSQTRKRYTIVE